jgi:hypothetical protein
MATGTHGNWLAKPWNAPWGETKNLVGACIYLASGASNNVTGAGISVDDG